jgi:hypothetical protein
MSRGWRHSSRVRAIELPRPAPHASRLGGGASGSGTTGGWSLGSRISQPEFPVDDDPSPGRFVTRDRQLPQGRAGVISPDTECRTDHRATAPRPRDADGEQGLVVEQGSLSGAEARIVRRGPRTLPGARGHTGPSPGRPNRNASPRRHGQSTSPKSGPIAIARSSNRGHSQENRTFASRHLSVPSPVGHCPRGFSVKQGYLGIRNAVGSLNLFLWY